MARDRSNAVSADARNGAEFDPSKEGAGKSAESVSFALYGIGAAAAVAGVVLLVVGWRQHAGREHAGLRLRRAAAGVAP